MSSFFNYCFVYDELVAPTMTAHCNNLRWDTKSSLSKQDIISMSTFPQDFDFMTENLDSISYVCRMSVPPIMIKRVAERLKPILLREKKIKNSSLILLILRKIKILLLFGRSETRIEPVRSKSGFGGDLLKTLSTDIFALYDMYVVGAVAEHTAGLIFFENDLVAVDIDFHRILLFYVHCFAQFLRQNDPAKLVDLTYDAC